MHRTFRFTLGFLVLTSAVSASAQQVFASNYSMVNGQGQDVGGTYNYWDGTYNGAGSPNVSLSPLSGGSGQLTNGMLTNLPWYLTSNDAGTGAYVGWLTVSPVITFNFASSVTINTVMLNLDDSAFGGVFLPQDVVINGKTYFINPALNGSPTPADLLFSGVGFTGTSLTVELDRTPNTWVFLNQARFNVVPEPAPIAALGMGALLLIRRRAKR